MRRRRRRPHLAGVTNKKESLQLEELLTKGHSMLNKIFALIPLGADGNAAGQPILVGAGPLDGSDW